MSTSGLLKGKVALITGASSGIGPAIAQRYAREGATLILCARRSDALAGLAEDCNQRYATQCFVHTADLSKPQEVDSFVDAVLQGHAHVDVLVNNAGMGVTGTPLTGTC